MAKDPAMLFYTQDFLTGVSDLTMEERGEYITLLCLHHQKGRLTKKAVALAVAKPSADVIAKFEIDENGLLYNKRLEAEAKKRAQHTEKQRNRALSGWKKRRAAANAVADAVALPLENENENEIINTNRNNFRKGGVGEKPFAELYPTFDDFWELYDKKIDKKKTKSKWKNLKQDEKEAIMDYIPLYLQTTPDKKFRRDPATFINNQTWENEIIAESKPLTHKEKVAQAARNVLNS